MGERFAEHFENRTETPEEIREKLKNPAYLPTIEEIKKEILFSAQKPFLLEESQEREVLLIFY